jgi:hypothetical protein
MHRPDQQAMLDLAQALGQTRDSLWPLNDPAASRASVLKSALLGPTEDLTTAVEALRRFQDASLDSAIARGAGDEVIARLDTSAQDFQTEAYALLADLHNLMATTGYKQALAWVDDLLQRLPAPQQSAPSTFDPEYLPYRRAEPPAGSPFEETANPVGPSALRATLSPQSISPAVGLSPLADDLPTAADTQEDGIEIVFDPAIVALAAELDYNVTRIYEYVRNEIDFEPTYGSIKGAVGTLASKSGNAFDQASLLIALLRASGIPARYEVGTIQVSPERAMGWVGVQDATPPVPCSPAVASPR